jgi:hypothetical protein
MALPVVIGAGLAAGGLAGSLFGKKKKSNIDTGYLTGLVNQSTGKQRDIVGQRDVELAPLYDKYKADSAKLGEDYLTSTRGASEQYKKDVAGLGLEDRLASQKAGDLLQKQQFRSVPGQQQAIKESLAATGSLRSGGGRTALAQPTKEAYQNVSDFRTEQEVQNLQQESARKEQAISNVYSTELGAQLTKLGLDKDTMQYLVESGRGDIINRAADLLGIEQSQLNAMLGIYGLKANEDMANATAENDRRQAIYNSLTGLGGSLIAGGMGGSSKAPSAPSSRLFPNQKLVY